MEYNTTRSAVQMLEYGRGIQSMAEHLLTIEDKDQRRRQADAVINAMAALNPTVRAMEDYRQKLWDQLHFLTDFKLDVEAPFPLPTVPEAAETPERPAYPQTKMRNRQFGKKFDELLKRALEEQDAEKKQAFTQALGYYMKLAYTTWHKEQVHDEAIRVDLERLSGGMLQYQPGGVHVPFVPLPTRGHQGGNRLTAAPQGGNSGNRPFRSNGQPANGSSAQSGASRSFGSNKGRKFYKNRKG